MIFEVGIDFNQKVDLEGWSIFRQLILNKDDLTTRLVYADWLMEYGGEEEQERGNFIRTCIQCNVGDFQLYGDKDTRNNLITTLRDKLLKWIPSSVPFGNLGEGWEVEGVYPLKITYRNGFIEDIQCTLNYGMRFLPGLVAYHPLKNVYLTDKYPDTVSHGFCWFRENERWNYHSYCTIPKTIYDLLPKVLGQKDQVNSFRDRSCMYTSKEEAIRDLSTAFISWAEEGNPMFTLGKKQIKERE